MSWREFFDERVYAKPGYFPGLMDSTSDSAMHSACLEWVASNCQVVVEFGVRGATSTVALLQGLGQSGGHLYSYDIDYTVAATQLESMDDKPALFTFTQADTGTLADIPDCDFLYLDSLHDITHVTKELRFLPKVRRFVGTHDSTSCEHFDLTGPDPKNIGVGPAFQKLIDSGEFRTYFRTTLNNGCWILERVNPLYLHKELDECPWDDNPAELGNTIFDPSTGLGGTSDTGDQHTVEYKMWWQIYKRFKVRSFLSVGCGVGWCVKFHEDLGIPAFGIDGFHLCKQHCKFNPNNFILHNFNDGPLTKTPKVDLVWSAEFAEHVEERFTPNIVQTILNADPKYLVFVAADETIGGFNHCHMKSPSYWIEVFTSAGFKYEPELTEWSKSFIEVPDKKRERSFYKERGLVFSRNKINPNYIPPLVAEAPTKLKSMLLSELFPEQELLKVLYVNSPPLSDQPKVEDELFTKDKGEFSEYREDGDYDVIYIGKAHHLDNDKFGGCMSASFHLLKPDGFIVLETDQDKKSRLHSLASLMGWSIHSINSPNHLLIRVQQHLRKK
jgi:hypothetical protein